MKRHVCGIFAALVAGMLFCDAVAQTIVLDERDATVWAQEQLVRGRAEGTAAGTLYVNDAPVAFTADGGFSVPVRLGEGETTLVACAAGTSVCSDTVRWTLGYRLRPELYAYATVEGRTVTLHGRVLANPDSAALVFEWAPDPDNPQPLTLSVAGDSTATLGVPPGVPEGEYYFDWTATAADGDVGRARTFVTVDSSGVTAFDITRDHAAWIDRATIYEVTPYVLSWDGDLSDVLARIPDVVDLGASTLWIQPVFETHGKGQGYDITNYFRVRPDLGTEADLRRVVETAHAHGLKVLLDFVPNHTAVQHPYAQDAIAHGEASHYYDFYQRTRSNTRYARDENVRTHGEMQFVHFFWEYLKNLNYDNPEVQRWMEEAGRYWIETFDIDGYRIDAVWGLDARTPEAMQQWRFALKRLKPEIMLLGETFATAPSTFDNRYDVAYDWYDSYDQDRWVSHWTWQTTYSESEHRTVFNHPQQHARAGLLRAALTNNGRGFPEGAGVLRFMENNDVPRFIGTHEPQSVERAQLAAALIFSLPGVPLVYNGQEIGYGYGAQPDDPYKTNYIFLDRSKPVRAQDPRGLFPYYERLFAMRAAYPALYGDRYEEVGVSPAAAAGRVFAFRRWEAAENLFTVLNLGDAAVDAALDLPVDRLGLDPATTYYLTDLLTGEVFSGTAEELDAFTLSLPAYAARVFVLDDEIHAVPTTREPSGGELPATAVLAQNYPNPFNPATSLAFELPAAGHARLVVYDVTGREVAVLVDGALPGGSHTVPFDGGALASGTYFYRLSYEGHVHTRAMLLVK